MNRIAAIILAAGDSTRMGSPKPLLRLGEKCFLQQILEVYAGVGIPQFVVLGRNSDEIQFQTDLSGATVLVNPDPSRGLLSSLLIALDQVSTLDAFIMHPVDHPLVSADTVQRLIRIHFRIPACILIPEFAGRRGHPVLFPSRFFLDLRNAPLSEGARWVVRANRAFNHLVPVDDPAVLQNIDTPAAYEHLTGFPRLFRSRSR